MKARTQPIGGDTIGPRRTQSGSHLPLFAQPLGAPKFPVYTSSASTQRTFIWSRRAAVGLAVLTCGIFIVLARPNGAQNLPAGRSSTIAQAHPATPSLAPKMDAPEESRRPVDFYTHSVRDGLFSAPQPPAPAPVKVAPAPKPFVPKPVPPIPVPPMEVNPFADWAYTGKVTMGDQVIALLENTKTKEGQYVKAGDTMMNAQVAAVTDDMVTLQAGNKPYQLAKSLNVTVTQLDRSAMPAANGQPAQPQPGQQPQPAMMNMQVQPSDSQQMFTLPNGRQMNAQQWQRRSGRMNRNFNQPGG